MRLLPVAFGICFLASVGCTSKTSETAQLEQQCAQRLQGAEQKRPDEQIKGFCSCFVSAAVKKVPAQKIAEQFEKGDDPKFQQLLDPVLEQCNDVMNPDGES